MIAKASAISAPLPPKHHPTTYERHWTDNFIQDVKNDFKNYFTNEHLIFLGDTFLVAGILANSGLDRAFRDHWQTDIRSKTTDDLFSLPKTIGGFSYYYVPVYLFSMGIGHLREHTLLGNIVYTWGYRSFRTAFIGGIQQVFLTTLLGGGRPNKDEDSKWQPFQHNTGISGHSFYGAIPFLTAAMMTDTPLLKYGLYFCSMLPAISRINSDSHYLSQIILGWTLAFISAQSVYQSDLERKSPFQIGLYPRSQGAMLAAHLEF